MKKLLYILAGVFSLVVVAVIAAGVIITNLPTETYKKPIVDAVKKYTGRDLIIDGETYFSVFPNVALKVQDVTLTNWDVNKDEKMIFVREAELDLSFRHLIHGEIYVNKLSLINPSIQLEVQKTLDKTTKRANWQFGDMPSSSKPSGRRVSPKMKNISLNNIHIQGGHVRYIDHSSDVTHDVSDIVLDIDMPSLSWSADLDGEFSYGGKPYEFDLVLNHPFQLIHGQPVKIGGKVKAIGSDWTVQTLYTPMTQLKKMHWDIELRTNEFRMPVGSGGGSSSDQKNASKEPTELSFAALDTADMNIKFWVGRFITDQLVLKPLNLEGAVKYGRLESDVTATLMKDSKEVGRAVPKLKASEGEDGPRIGLQGDVNNVKVGQFVDKLDGTATISEINIGVHGRTPDQMIQNFLGKWKLEIKDGSIKGIDIVALLRSTKDALLSGNFDAIGEKKKTDFALMTGTFHSKEGVIHNPDLMMQAPLLRVNGMGNVFLVDQTVKYRVEPKLVGSFEGQGGVADMSGFTLPIMIEGPIRKPRFTPDAIAIANQLIGAAPQQILDEADGLRRKIEEAPEQLLKDIPKALEENPEQLLKDGEGLLNNIFGR